MQSIDDLFSKYKEIFVSPFIVVPKKTDCEYSVTLIEEDKAAKLKEITIHNVPKNTILLSLYQYSQLGIGNKLKKIIKADLGVFRCCDYVLATIDDNRIVLVYIEMKSEESQHGDIIKQFKGATCFIGYCHAIIQTFFNIPKEEFQSIRLYYVLISKARLNKKPTKNMNYKKHTSPENFYHHEVRIIDSKSAEVFFQTLLK